MLAITSGPGASISNYLNSGHTKWPNGSTAAVNYRFVPGTLGTCDAVSNAGVTVFVPYAPGTSEYADLNKLIDGTEADTNCGKIRPYGTAGRYILSLNSNELSF